jgi:hypothetical protein
MKHLILLLTLGVLGGCVSASPTTAPDGRPAYSVSCNGNFRDLGACYQKASEICHGPYDIIAGESGATAYYSATPQYGYGGSIAKRSIIVECKS